jgi:hypothetical protein
VTDLAPTSTGPPAGFAVERPWRAPTVAGGLALAGTAVLAVVDPEGTHVPLCPLRAVTGLDCPLCGSLRAVHALTRADLLEALDHNLLFTASIPALVVCWAVWLGRALGRDPAPGRHLPVRTGAVLLGLALLFGFLRNLPALSWLGSGA